MPTSSKTLQGLKVLNTRPSVASHQLNAAIIKKGGLSFSLPTLTIQPTSSAWADEPFILKPEASFIFISPNAVDFFLKTRPSLCKTQTVFAIGQATAQRLAHYGIKVKDYASEATSEALLNRLILNPLKNQIYILVKGVGGRTLIHDTLRQHGAIVKTLSVYKRSPSTLDVKYFKSIWHNPGIDIILFTSLESIEHFHQVLVDYRPLLIQKPCLVLSERLAEAVSRLGYKNILISTPQSILETLEAFAKGKS